MHDLEQDNASLSSRSAQLTATLNEIVEQVRVLEGERKRLREKNRGMRDHVGKLEGALA